MSEVLSLSSVVLPVAAGLVRDLPPRAGRDADGSGPVWADYDRRTLVYDVVHLVAAGTVRLYLPRLWNLAGLLRQARFRIDGQGVRPRRHVVFRRFEVIDFGVAGPAARSITIETSAAGALVAPINREAPEEFRQRRVIYTLLRNERPEWIRDWLIFHNRVHGADAVLIADNGSTDYSSAALLRVLDAVPGYAVRRVLAAPLPWGPRGAESGVDDGKYLQTALLNLVRDRFLSSADGVLNLDVDELLLRRGPRSVFEKVRRWGLVTFSGAWRYPAEAREVPLHRDHRHLDPQDRPCPTKYCYRPASRLGRMCLSVHSLERLNRRFFSGNGEFEFLHCRNISTSWKHDRTWSARPGMRLDPTTATALDAVFDRPDRQD